jgi:ammonia channel protein AmtB
VPTFVAEDRLEQAVRALFSLSFGATIVAVIVVSASRGIDRGDLFEIIVISIVWLTLIVAGPLLGVAFRRARLGVRADAKRGAVHST